ncbi:MAG: methylated-DNA--[protein]-cysteine S-methyltransferase [Cetobacterium sp.]|uniref:methylated-DNA--[protein]-cysteine S-methyltransferase n=1 Tax=Cetobacterium sp. TaxID=2071632 RepID=UPI003F3CA3D7
MKKKYAIYDSPIGEIKIEYEKEVVKDLYVKDKFFLEKGECSPITDLCYSQLLEYLKGERKEFSIPLSLEGTEFQKKVWEALKEIPYGKTVSYKDIAIAIGNPKGARAVGMANNRNPIMIIVPCHRVIGKNGKLVGYGGGLPLKEKLLEIEKNNRFAELLNRDTLNEEEKKELQLMLNQMKECSFKG